MSKDGQRRSKMLLQQHSHIPITYPPSTNKMKFLKKATTKKQTQQRRVTLEKKGK